MRCPVCGYHQNKDIKKRSNKENRVLHGLVLPILAQHTGYTVLEMKRLVKSMFLRDEFMLTTKNGLKEISTVRETSELTTIEFEKFLTDIRQWASRDLELVIPEPNQQEDA